MVIPAEAASHIDVEATVETALNSLTGNEAKLEELSVQPDESPRYGDI